MHSRALLQVGVQHVPDVGEVPCAASRTHREQKLLCPAQRNVGVGPTVETYAGDSTANFDKLAHNGHALDDLGVVLDVDGGGDHHNQVAQVTGASDALQMVGKGQLVGHRDLVDRLAPFEQGYAGVKAVAISLAIKVA